nr:alpha/beta fold hydrolase [Rhizobium changzhiense]
MLAFLQGGPGGKSPRPSNGGPPWLAEALKTHRVILIDQRGTGRSSRIESATMERFADGRAAADYLTLFRADSIVADCEHLRKTVFGGGRWQTLGQSYGGFLTLPISRRRRRDFPPVMSPAALPALGRRPMMSIGAPTRASPKRTPPITAATPGMPSASAGLPTISRPMRCGCPMAIASPFAAFRLSASISVWRRATRTSTG